MSKKSRTNRGKVTAIADLNDGVLLLPGRRLCSCEATRHALVANCLSCGRIVCEQEGSGDCFTCGQLVIKAEERRQMIADIQNKQLLNSMAKEDSMSNNTLNSGLKDIAASLDKTTGLDKAVRHKDRMLEFDRNSSVRTKVIDDENDYFSLESDKWISNGQRKAITAEVAVLHENKLKKNTKVLIDLVGHTATDYKEPVIKDFDGKVQQLMARTQLKSDYESVDTSSLIDDRNQQSAPNLVYIENKKKDKDQASEDQASKDLIYAKGLINAYSKLRIQDKEFLEISDEGMCLSVNQPFASLLVAGIKKFEGRNWYSPFRGRLWIHSNSQKLDQNRVKEVENMYRYAGAKNLPTNYPLSALVGCVTVTECLPFEEYQQRFPNGDTEANYIFVCEDPKQLAVSVPIAASGQRIWKLNESIHLVARKHIEL